MNHSANKDHVVIITYNNDIFTNPTLDLFFKKLLEQKISVILIAPPQHYYTDYSKAFTFIEPPLFIYNWSMFSLKGKLGVWRAYRKLASKLKRVSKAAVIGIDPLGFVTAARLNKRWKSKLGYFSFEIFFKDEIKAYEKRTNDSSFTSVKEAELEYFKKCDFLLIQDEYRLKLIVEENDFSPPNYFLIPVSTVAENVNDKRFDKLSGKNELGIPAEKRVIVYSGSLQEWSGMQKLLEHIEENWDKRFWLLLHSRFELKNGDPFFDKVTALHTKGFPISLHNQPFDNMLDLEIFLSQFDFGLVTYFPMKTPYTGKNISEIGLASGKFSMYMMLGLPVIVTKCETYTDLLKEFNFGVLASSPEDISLKLPFLMENYEARSEACKELYRKYLNPEDGLNELISFIMKK